MKVKVEDEFFQMPKEGIGIDYWLKPKEKPMRYAPTEEQEARREKNFHFHEAQDDQSERYTNIRSGARGLARLFDQSCPPSRELSLAMTKLEEAVMWANAAIARNE